MSAGVRLGLFLAGMAGLLALWTCGALGLQPVGGYRGPYGWVLNSVAVAERHGTDVVTSVNFDYRGFDTLGEEFILFTSVTGVWLLLRQREEEAERNAPSSRDEAPGKRSPRDSEAVRALCGLLVGVSVAFGLYIVTHGQLTPGGGFQGGVLLATVPLLVYLTAGPRPFLKIAPKGLVEPSESAGALGFLLIGFLGFLSARPFLTNVLPLGPVGKVESGGTIPFISVATGLEVAAGFVLLLIAFLHETLKGTGKGERP